MLVERGGQVNRPAARRRPGPRSGGAAAARLDPDERRRLESRRLGIIAAEEPVGEERARARDLKVWAIGAGVDEALLERLGDARQAADALGCGAGVFVTGAGRSEALRLIACGADRVCHVVTPLPAESTAATAEAILRGRGARLVLACGDCEGREGAARLAARLGWRLVSPALSVRVLGEAGALEVTELERGGRLARQVRVAPGEGVVVTLRAGVAEARRADPERTGEVEEVEPVERPARVRRLRLVPADPATVDIRYAARLVAGGRGVGGREGFERLRRFADRIGAGVAASRMAVDSGWVGHERQVGQTGKSVAPDLYIACGISGASHHLDGLAGAGKIVAINTDPEAPIFKAAHLGLVADLFSVLERAEAGLGVE
jgi:electron transfer flavoprotein alpha subunit